MARSVGLWEGRTDLVAIPFVPPLGEGGGRGVEGRGGAGEARGVAEVVPQHRQGLHRPWGGGGGGGGGLHIVPASVVCFAGDGLTQKQPDGGDDDGWNRISSSLIKAVAFSCRRHRHRHRRLQG